MSLAIDLPPDAEIALHHYANTLGRDAESLREELFRWLYRFTSTFNFLPIGIDEWSKYKQTAILMAAFLRTIKQPGEETVQPPPPLTVAEAVALYDARAVSQGRAAALCGLSRAAFIDALSAAGVSPFQYDSAEELLREAGLA